MQSRRNSEQMGLFQELPNVAKRVKVEPPKNLAPCTKCTEQYLSDRQVALRFDISKATVWRWHDNNPDFPRRIKLSPGTSRWRLSDLVQFEMKMQTANPSRFVAETKGKSR